MTAKEQLRQKLQQDVMTAGLFSKWSPRKTAIANKLRKAWGFLTPKEYRQYIVGHTNVIESAMCNREFGKIEYAHVPSVAMARYNSAFARNDETRFAEYKAALAAGTTKINAGAILPHDIVRTARGSGYDVGVLQAQWEAQPNFIPEGTRMLPMSDVSGSMDQDISGSVSAMDVSIALGVYIAERQTGAFKDLVLTFSSDPQFHVLTGTNVVEKINGLQNAEWGMSTNIEKAFLKILDTAVRNGVTEKDMPEYLIVLSDMEWNAATHNKETNHQAAQRAFENAGYKLPRVIYWNLASRTKNSPVTTLDTGTALVSGFSPALLKAVLSGEEFNPWDIMLNVIGISRYDVEGWTI